MDEKKGSVLQAAMKARAHRVERLRASLGQRLENVFAPIDALMAEAGDGDPQTELWERLHAAAVRDGIQSALSDAYARACVGPRMKRLSRTAQAAVLVHAADWFQGALGDATTAEGYLERVLAIVPGHPEAFARLEKRLEKLLDQGRMLHLYASVADSPPRPANVLANQTLLLLLSLKPKDVLSDEACRKLVALVPANAKLLDALEAHTRTTKRPALAAELIEQALLDETMAEEQVVQRRQRLLELYAGEVTSPGAAVVHVEELLKRDPSDVSALRAGERLLGSREHASRAAAALAAARRARGA
jgi:hypothetical protein